MNIYNKQINNKSTEVKFIYFVLLSLFILKGTITGPFFVFWIKLTLYRRFLLAFINKLYGFIRLVILSYSLHLVIFQTQVFFPQ